MPFAAKEGMLASPSVEEIFSLAAGAAALESHQGANALKGQKPHQGIFSKNHSTCVSEMWVKWSGTHQVSEWYASEIVLGPTIYLYDGANLLEEFDSGGNVLARYTQDVGIDQLLSELRSGTTSYYHQDALGSVTSLSNGAGALANTYSYDSFGKLTASTGTTTNPFQYTGREFDPETGLSYYRARYYDPSAGRFLSEDPLGFGAGDANFYPYVGNSPTNMIDPSGKSAGPAPALGPAPGYCAANPLVCIGVIDGVLLAYDSYEAYQLGVAYG